MNWDAVGAIAEAAGAVAVIISLIYVAVQIRQNTQQLKRSVEASKLAALEQNIEAANHSRELLILNPDLAQLLKKGFENYNTLESGERFRFSLMLRNLFSSMQGAYIRQLTVDHDPLRITGSVRVIDELLVNPGVQQWLSQYEPDWRPEFRAVVDQRLEVLKNSNQESGDTD